MKIFNRVMAPLRHIDLIEHPDVSRKKFEWNRQNHTICGTLCFEIQIQVVTPALWTSPTKGLHSSLGKDINDHLCCHVGALRDSRCGDNSQPSPLDK